MVMFIGLSPAPWSFLLAKLDRVIQRRQPGRHLELPGRYPPPMFAAVAIEVENIDDHRQRDFVVDSGISLEWANERTQRFLQEHLTALRDVAAQLANDELSERATETQWTPVCAS